MTPIAYRAFLDQRPRRPHHESLLDATDDRAEGLHHAAEQSESRDRLNAAIADLTAPIREVVLLQYMGGLSLRQPTEPMGISEETVKSRLNAALTKLRRALE